MLIDLPLAGVDGRLGMAAGKEAFRPDIFQIGVFIVEVDLQAARRIQQIHGDTSCCPWLSW